MFHFHLNSLASQAYIYVEQRESERYTGLAIFDLLGYWFSQA
jgi:hypothetical protein